ncbi:MAG: SpoIIE family protein phosphatase [Desulfomonile tiedjei]|uniref:SpoIIE family protein phosphatase n=1 Tax=Desulfomonile tiedjei TaxID=2358 RepID=A0A9D6Z2I8_9BACT|nr:SpoIIE family protein phosphatase [Desulfomonile tiedjei]
MVGKKKNKILIVDDTPENIQVLMETLKDRYAIVAAINGEKALKIAATEPRPDLILLDIMMPGMDGYEVCRRLKADEQLLDIPIIFVTAKTEVEDETLGFELGAVDYITKPFSIPVVKARVKAHLDLKRLRDLEAIQRAKLEATLGKLNSELAEAADYVKFLLPQPLTEGPLKAYWRFVPSTTLGGDALGYHWVDEDSFAIYLVDVCGHGVGAALHSVSVLNVLRSENLQNTDFRRPDQVLAGLNAVFPMEYHKDMYFTIWYGVYNRVSHLLTYASGGHPPALLIENMQGNGSEIQELKTPNLIIGGLADADFDRDEVPIKGPARLYVFSDGVFEITNDNGQSWGLDDLTAYLKDSGAWGKSSIDDLWAHVRQIAGSNTLEDDFSVLEIMIP